MKLREDAVTERKYSNCILGIRDHVPVNKLEGVDLGGGYDARHSVPILSFLNVKKFNPVIFRDSDEVKREFIIPNYRRSDSSRYFQGCSIALVPGRCEETGEVSLSFDTIFANDDDAFIRKDNSLDCSTVVFYDFPLESVVSKPSLYSNISVYSPDDYLLLKDPLRDFFRNPQVVRAKTVLGGTNIAGYFVFDKNSAREVSGKIFEKVKKRLDLDIGIDGLSF